MRGFSLWLLFAFSALFSMSVASTSTSIAPVVIVPGLSASALQNIETNDRMWVNLTNLLNDKFYVHLATHWSNSTGRLLSNESITPYCGLEGVCDIAGTHFWDEWKEFNEFADLVAQIRQHSGGVTAVPYDWRLVPQEENLQQFVFNMESAITELYNLYHQPVYVVAHSLGNLMTLYFFNNMSNTNFTSKYVAGYVGVAPPYGGAGLGLAAVVDGVVDSGKKINSSLLGNFASFPWVFPQPRVFENETVVIWGNRDYPASGIPDFMNIYSFNNQVQDIYRNIISKFNYSIFEAAPPGLTLDQVHLYVSENVSTCYGVGFIDNRWILLTEQVAPFGDGTVPYRSLHANDRAWDISPKIYQGVSHSMIIQFPEFISDLIQLLGGTAQPGTV